jgi:hypothetical protein
VLVALSAVALALLPAPADAKPLIITRSNATYFISADVYTIACDGVDSFRVTVTTTPGNQVLVGGVLGTANRRGIFRTDVTPPVADPATGPGRSLVLGAAPFTSATRSPHRLYSCPFVGEFDTTLTLTRPNGKPYTGKVYVGFGGGTFVSTYARRLYDAGANGRVQLETLGSHDGWYVCVSPQGDGRLRVATVNEQPARGPSECGTFPIGGDVSVGLARN